MPQCPVCHHSVTHKVLDEWFKCPSCKMRIRLRLKQNDSVWVEKQFFENSDIPSFKIDRELLPLPPKEQFPASRTIFPNAENTNLRSLQPDDLHFKDKYENGKFVLPEQKLQNNQPTNSSEGKGWVFGCGTILAGLGIYVFSRLIGLQLDFGGYVTLVIVSLVSGLFIYLIAK